VTTNGGSDGNGGRFGTPGGLFMPDTDVAVRATSGLKSDVWYLPAVAIILGGGQDASTFTAPPASGDCDLRAILASMEDTNLLHRGGAAGLRYAQEAAARFLGQGGVKQAKWREQAAAVHRAFVARTGPEC
jgi:hypothetical protein